MNFFAMFIAVIVVFAILVISELGLRRGWLKGEVGRKFVHIFVGTFVAFWPFFMGWDEIRLISIAFFLGVVLAFRLGVFRAVSTYQRPTYGEVLFALSVGFLTLITQSKGVYAAAILQMAVADGFAAIIGKNWGKTNSYKVWSSQKSFVGTATFLALSLTILVGYSLFSDNGLAVQYILLGGIAATIVENCVSLGLDNLFVPAMIGILLQSVA